MTKKDDKEELRQYPVVLKEEEYDSVVQIKVRAHNSMGGYVSDNIYCPLNNEYSFLSFISFSITQVEYSIDESFYNSEADMKEFCAKIVASEVQTINIDKRVKEGCERYFN